MRLALVIGLGMYRLPDKSGKGGLGGLPGTEHHGNRVAEELEKAGFTTIKLPKRGDTETPLWVQGSRQRVCKVIQDFRDQLADQARKGGKEIVAFFYYSGHGAYNGKHHFLLPTDCEQGIDGDLQGVDFEECILTYMVKYAHKSIAVLDCCRKGQNKHYADSPRVLTVPREHQYLVCHACGPYKSVPNHTHNKYSHTLHQRIFKPGVSFIQEVGKLNAELDGEHQAPEFGPHRDFSPGFILVNE